MRDIVVPAAVVLAVAVAITLTLVCLQHAVAAQPRDGALRACNGAAVARWSYRGTASDKMENRDAVYRACMQSYAQTP